MLYRLLNRNMDKESKDPLFASNVMRWINIDTPVVPKMWFGIRKIIYTTNGILCLDDSNINQKQRQVYEGCFCIFKMQFPHD
jgi:hypothetical protein